MAPPNKLHIVFAGNPGVGKSSILNSLIGKVVFNAGVSIGRGLTEVLDSHELQDRTYSDTPGLDDVNMRQKAAKEISTALSGGGKFKLIFVCTLEECRVRPADITTICVVLKAIEDIGVKTEGRYSVIVNKCNDGEMEAFNSFRNRETIRGIISAKKKLKHLGFFPVVPLASGKEDFLIEDNSSYVKFVEEAPSVKLPTKPVNVDASTFDNVRDKLEKELKELKAKLAEFENERDDDKWNALLNNAVHGVCQGVASGAFKTIAKSVLT